MLGARLAFPSLALQLNLWTAAGSSQHPPVQLPPILFTVYFLLDSYSCVFLV